MTYQDVVNIIRDAANYINPNGFFIHGRKTDGSLQYNEATPQIILLEPQPNTAINNNNFFETTVFPIIFVTQDSPESTEVERENIKQSMYLLSRKLLAKIDEQPLLQDVQYTGGQPEIRQLSGTMTGFSYSLQLSYPLSECSLDLDLPPTIKLFATQTSVASGTQVQIGWIAENVNSVVITPFGTLQGQFGFVNTTINSTTSFFGTATNDAGTATDTLTITVGNGCDDATAVLKNTDGTTLSTTDIPSGDTQDIIAPDGHVHIKKENDGTIANVFPPSGATVNYIVQDNDVEVNGVVQGSIHATETVDIQLEDSFGNPVAPTLVTQAGNTFTIEVPSGGLTADFSVDDTTPETNQTITFTDLSIGATTWLWTIRLDGGTYENTSTLQNPTFQLPYVGTYTVTLSITDGSGGEGVETKASYINASLQPLPTTNLQAHYDAMQGASPSNLTLVSGVASQWNDDVIGYHLAQGSPTARPLYTFPAITSANGTQYGELTGDGINDFLQNTNALFTRGQNTTVYLVIKFLSNIGSGVFLMQNGTTAATAGVQILANNNQYTLSNGLNASSWMMFPQGGYAAVRFQFATSNAEVQINEFIKIISGTGTNTGAGLTLFSNYLGTANINVSIAKCIVYSSPPSGVDNDKVFQHIKAQLGIGQCL